MNIIYPVCEFTIQTLETSHSTEQQWANMVLNGRHQRRGERIGRIQHDVYLKRLALIYPSGGQLRKSVSENTAPICTGKEVSGRVLTYS